MSPRVRSFVALLLFSLPIFGVLWGCADMQDISPSPGSRPDSTSVEETREAPEESPPPTPEEIDEESLPPKTELNPELSICPETVQLGEYVVVGLRGVPRDADVEIIFAGDVWDHSRQDEEVIVALVPVSYYSEPGIRVIEAVVRMPGVTEYAYGRFRIAPADFETQRLYVDSELESRRSPDLWAQDRVHFERARAKSHSKALWKGEFIMPVEGRLTSSFGLLRYVNDVVSGRHSGLDISAVEGTPIEATASGVVTLAMDLNVTGGTIIIDHGLNLFSLYYHLSAIAVEEGEEIDGGE
ncbi:MAG: M23 family metallopeptidase, partial [Clostridia bacterium]